MKPKCICGCRRQRGVQFHHVIYQQELRRLAGQDIIREEALRGDRRNLVPVGPNCHERHHSRSRPFELAMLPDSVFGFAEEVMGAGRAYEYLRRYYKGDDSRLDALLETADAA